MRDQNITTYRNLQLNYFGIPKAGNTTMKFTLLKADNPLLFEKNLKSRSTTRNFVGNITNSWIHNVCELITVEEAKANGFLNFTVIRNPIDRFFSMYKSLPRLGRNMTGNTSFMKDINENFDSILSPVDLLQIISKYPDEERNIHLRSQQSFLPTRDVKTLKLESLTNTIKEVHPKLEVKDHLNKIEEKFECSVSLENSIKQIFKTDFDLYGEVV